MSKRHYVITTRPVHKVTVENLPDQFWYEHDTNTPADVATPFVRCGIYTDRQGQADKPAFFAPGSEDADYTIGGADPFKPQGGSLEQFNLLFNELEQMQKNLLIFMYGFENNIKGELEHLELLHKDYIEKEGSSAGRVLMITWPSQGLLKYNEEIRRSGKIGAFLKKLFGNSSRPDENLSDAAVTGRAMAVWILKLLQFAEDRYSNPEPGRFRPRISCIVQSMANHVIRFTAAELKRLQKLETVAGIFDDLILTSPDIRDTIFENDNDYRNASVLGKNTWLVYSPQDPVLKKGDWLYPYIDPVSGKKQPRLGRNGPASVAGLPPNLFKVEVQQQHIINNPLSDFNHRYFEFNDKVIGFYNSIANGSVPKKDHVLQV